MWTTTYASRACQHRTIEAAKTASQFCWEKTRIASRRRAKPRTRYRLPARAQVADRCTSDKCSAEMPKMAKRTLSNAKARRTNLDAGQQCAVKEGRLGVGCRDHALGEFCSTNGESMSLAHL